MQTPTRTVLIVGGTGMLGQAVARQLLADGWQVRVLTHSPSKARHMFDPAFHIVEGDVDHPSTIVPALEGCHGVHINLFGGPDPALEARGVRNVAAAAARAGITRLTYLSGSTVSEAHSTVIGTRVKLEAEQAIREAGLPYTIFRASFFMESLPRYVRGSSASIIGTQPHPRRFVAAADYARMVSRAYDEPGSANRILYVFGPEPLTVGAALTRYCQIVHPGVQVRSMPFWLAQSLASVFLVRDLRDVLPYMRYFETTPETGDATEANRLLGAPATTLTRWCEDRRTQLPGHPD